ncbi:MAG: hypothetical protein FWC41_11410 [Firmicutes bacterium]|nr:hypothetical protein [Bacillota bacterium]
MKEYEVYIQLYSNISKKGIPNYPYNLKRLFVTKTDEENIKKIVNTLQVYIDKEVCFRRITDAEIYLRKIREDELVSTHENGIVIQKTETCFIPLEEGVSKEELIKSIKGGNILNDDNILIWDGLQTLDEFYHGAEIDDTVIVVFNGEKLQVTLED